MSEELLVRYVETALSRREAGESLDIEQLCEEHPEMVPMVREALDLEDALPDTGHRDPLVGKLFDGRYLLQEVIGAGAMGAVYEAEDKRLSRQVAVKVLHPGVITSKPREQRFLREARVLAALEHRSIVAIYDHGRTAEGWHYIVMERLRGASLAAVLGDEEFAAKQDYLPRVVSWVADLASALQASHDCGVFHRDIKPSNAFVTEDGRPVLLDFGIAVREGDEPLTMGGTTVGTPWYMAPEQAAGGQATVAASDVYGLSATLYHLVTFRPPYTGEFAEVLTKLQREDPLPARKVRKDVPQDLGAIIDKGLSRRPEDRYADMAAFEADLRSFLSFRSVQARPLGLATRSLRWLRRRPGVVAASAVGVAAVGAAVVLTLVWQARQRHDLAQFHQQFATIPAAVAIEGFPQKRLFHDVSEIEESIRLLNELLELKPDAVGVRLYRAALLLDRGKHAASAADLHHIAEQHPSSYMRAVASAYAHAPKDQRGSAAIRLSRLPEPQTAPDWFVSGFHLLRSRKDPATAHAHLAKAADYLPARDLQLISALNVAEAMDRGPARRAFYRELRADAQALQVDYGFTTARIQNVLGQISLALNDYETARKHFRTSVDLCPLGHSSINNLGCVLNWLGEFDEAERVLKSALKIRPWSFTSRLNLAQVYAARGHFELAMDTAKKLPVDQKPRHVWERAFQMGRIAEQQAFKHFVRGELAEIDEPADTALAFYDEGRQQGGPKELFDPQREFVRFMRSKDREHTLGAYLDSMCYDAANPELIRDLIQLLPDKKLSAALTANLKTYLRALAETLGPALSEVAEPANKAESVAPEAPASGK